MKAHLCFGLLVVGMAVTACDPSVYQDSRTQFVGYGDSVRQNNAVMIIDPQPVSAANVDIDFDGRKDSIAIERYRTGQVIPPEDLTTTN
ncbi:hypothetical protein [Dongia deserti]|uniref:hypothetical protein n=1 Tax=Dongia deserti TaxID=2268030 RepID=UPI000E65E7AD|nr:hypothetical protein [Dongia deserti]